LENKNDACTDVAEVKKCKCCGKVLKDTEKDFCSNDYCEGKYLWDEYCKKEYGKSNCVICGKEFLKQSPTDDICRSYACLVKKRIAEKENTYDDVTMQEDIFESEELEENFLPEIENDNCSVQCNYVPDDALSKEVPQDSEIKRACYGEQGFDKSAEEAKQLQSEIKHIKYLKTEQDKLQVEIDNFGKRFTDFENKFKHGECDLATSAEEIKKFRSELNHLRSKNKKLQVENETLKKHFVDFQDKFKHGGRKGYDRLMAETVKLARDNGETWRSLSARLGISTNTAQKLYKSEEL